MEEYNDLFWKTYDLLEETKSWSTLQFREYQLQKLKELIGYAYANTKYYRRMFDEYGWTPRDFRNFHDIRKIPILTKDILEKNLNELRAIPLHNCVAVTTGVLQAYRPSYFWMPEVLVRLGLPLSGIVFMKEGIILETR